MMEAENVRPIPVEEEPRHRSLRATLDTELDTLRDDVLRLGGRVIDSLERAERALVERDVDLADRVRWDDAQTNELQRRVNAEITTMVATQQPMARDVRIVLSLHHAAAELERMGDYAVSIAKLAQQMASEPEVPIFPQIPRMAQICREQLGAAMRALVDVSEEEARAMCARDDEIDHLYSEVYEGAVELMEKHPERARQTTHQLFAAHNLERLGDRVTNIGEDVVYLATGRVEDLNT